MPEYYSRPHNPLIRIFIPIGIGLMVLAYWLVNNHSYGLWPFLSAAYGILFFVLGTTPESVMFVIYAAFFIPIAVMIWYLL